MRHALAMLAVSLVVFASAARAQTGDTGFGTSDTVFTTIIKNPIYYMTSYDRDVSTGTWNQSLTYGFNRPRIALNTNGSYSTVEQIGIAGQGAGSGNFLGHLDVRAARSLIFSADGRFTKSSNRDAANQSWQRQNRLKLSSQYSVNPSKAVQLQALLFSEFQGDHSLAVRPVGQGLLRTFVIRNPNGDSVGVDTLFVQRDSTITTGRQDGLTGQVNWKPTPWFQVMAAGFGNRVRPTTTSHLTGNEPRSTTFDQRLDKNGGSNPNDNYQYQSKMTYHGPRGLATYATFFHTRSDQTFYDRTALRQELFSSDQRSGALHLEQAPLRGFLLSLDGSVARSLGQYRFRNNLNSLVDTKAGRGSLMYNPGPLSRAGLEFDLQLNRNSRQQFGNGKNISRFAQATGAHRLTRRLSLDAVATASLISFHYVDDKRDQDNAKQYVNVGSGYQVSARCSTQVHFSITRAHTVWIDPSQSSSNNNIQTTYQMDAMMKLGVTPRLTISQVYLLNALYQIYDFALAESKNTLSRIRRIDTVASDSLFRFASFSFTHNFFFRDFGSFTRTSPEEARGYRVFSQTYTQVVSAAVNVKPMSGVFLSASQSLSNTRLLTSGPTTATNHWNLTLGMVVNRDIFGGANLNGSLQHISAYDEVNAVTPLASPVGYWIAGATLVKAF